MSKTKPFAKRIVSVAAALTMTVGSVPMPAIAEETTIPNNGIFSNVQCIPHMSLAHFEEGSQMLDTGLLETTIIWSNLAPATIEENEPAEVKYVDFTATVTTQSGAERKPWWYSTTPNYEEYPMAGAFVLDGEGNGKMTFWMPCLGTEDGQAIVETAQKLLRHKVNGEGEEVTFDDLVNKIQDTFKKATLPSYVEGDTKEAFVTVDSDEQEALITVLEPIGDRFITENESGTPTEELTMTSDEQKQLVATVTGMMGLDFYPTSGVAEGDTVTVTMDAVEVTTTDDKFGALDLTGIEPITFVVSVENNGKVIGGTKCEHDGDRTYVSTGTMSHNIVCAKCNTVLQADVPHSYGVQEYDTDNHWTPCLYCKEKLDLTKHTLTYEHDDSTHWQVCSGCDYKSEAAAHEWEWVMDSNGIYTGQKCVCGATREEGIPGVVDLSKTTPVYPDGKNATSEFTKEEAGEIGLKDENNVVIDKDSYNITVETSKDDDSKWTVDYKSLIEKSIGEKTVEVKKACEHDGEKTYESTGPNFHNIICAKCSKVVYSSIAHTSDDVIYYDTENHWTQCNYCKEKLDVTKHSLSYQHDDDTHWQVCSGCNYKSAAAAHEWEWVMDSNGIYTGQKCKCGATRKEGIPDVVDLSKATPVYPEGMDENSEYTKEEAETIGLKDENGEAIDKDCYTVTVDKNKDDSTKLTIEYKSVEDKSIGKKEVTVIKGEDTYSVTVNYSMADGRTKPSGFVAQQVKEGLKKGEAYSIDSPVYKYYKASIKTVAGNMGEADITVSVTYDDCDHTDYTLTGSYIKPTCTEDAKAVMAKCDDCGAEISLTAAQIKALGEGYVATGHNFDDEWHKEYSVSSKPGAGHYHKCQNSGCYERQYEAHTWTGETKTGTKCGVDLTISDECSVCGATYSYQPAECDYVRAPELDVAPTCEEYGFEKYKCSVCGTESSDAIQPLGHDMQETERVAATCETVGYVIRKCSREGCDKEEKEIIPMLSQNGQHNFQRVVKREPTCDMDGRWEGEACTNPGCNATRNESAWGTIEHLGHSMKEEKMLMRQRTVFDKGGFDKTEQVYCVSRECTRCGKSVKAQAYTVTYSQKLNKYNITRGMNAEITDLKNGIHLKGQFDKNESIIFYKTIGDALNKIIEADTKDYEKTEGSIILTFTDEFLATLDDGEYGMIICNGDEFSEIAVTVKDHKFAALDESTFDDVETVSNEEFEAFLADVEGEVEREKYVFVAQPYLENDALVFDKKDPHSVGTELNLGDYELSSIKFGDRELTPDECSFEGGYLSIGADVFMELDEGDYVFTIEFSGEGDLAEPDALRLTVTVKDTTGDDSSDTDSSDTDSSTPNSSGTDSKSDSSAADSSKSDSKTESKADTNNAANTNPNTGAAAGAGALVIAALAMAVITKKRK